MHHAGSDQTSGLYYILTSVGNNLVGDVKTYCIY